MNQPKLFMLYYSTSQSLHLVDGLHFLPIGWSPLPSKGNTPSLERTQTWTTQSNGQYLGSSRGHRAIHSPLTIGHEWPTMKSRYTLWEKWTTAGLAANAKLVVAPALQSDIHESDPPRVTWADTSLTGLAFFFWRGPVGGPRHWRTASATAPCDSLPRICGPPHECTKTRSTWVIFDGHPWPKQFPVV